MASHTKTFPAMFSGTAKSKQLRLCTKLVHRAKIFFPPPRKLKPKIILKPLCSTTHSPVPQHMQSHLLLICDINS